MMKRLLVLVLCLLLCVPALAEEPARTSDTLNGTLDVAAVGGEVYCMTATEGWRAETTIFRMTQEGLTPVWTGKGNGFALFEMDGQLLLTATEKTFLQDLTGAGGTWTVTRIDPATGEALRLMTTKGDGRAVCLDGALCWFESRWMGGSQEEPAFARLRRWDGEAWQTILDWTGSPAAPDDLSSQLSYLYPDFVLLEKREASRDVEDMTLYLLDSGETVKLHGVPLYGSDMLLMDGVLYTKGRDGIYAHDLATDTSRQLLALPERSTYGFALDDTRLIVMPSDGCVAVYDRADMTLLRKVELPSGALHWVLLGDWLYALDPTTSYSSVGGEVTFYEPAYCAVANIESGECWTTLLDGKDGNRCGSC